MLYIPERKIIAGVGEGLLDVPSDGHPVLGGALANFSIHSNQFGNLGILVSAIGNDQNGDFIRQSLTELGASDGYLMTVDRPTSTVTVEEIDGKPEYIIHKDVAWDCMHEGTNPELYSGLASKCSVVCYGTLASRSIVSRKFITRFITNTPEDCVKVFDVNLRRDGETGDYFWSKGLLNEYLGFADLLKLNHEEIEPVITKLGYEFETESKAIKLLIEKYQIDTVILTKGEMGSRVVTVDKVDFSQPCMKNIAKPRTVGAGDVFTAAYVSAIANGHSPEDALKIAGKASEHVCLDFSPTPKLPDEIIDLVKN